MRPAATMPYTYSRCRNSFLAFEQVRETEMIEGEGVLDLAADLITTTTHKVPLTKLKARLASSGCDPREAALKSKLR